MRFLFLAGPCLAVALCVGGCSASPKHTSVHYSAPSVAPVRDKISRAQVSIDTAITAAAGAKIAIAHAANILRDSSSTASSFSTAIPQLEEALGEAEGKINDLTTQTETARGALGEAQADITTLEGKVETITADLNTCGDDKNTALDQKDAAIAQAARDARKYHRLKFAVCSLAAALACFLAVKLGLLKLLTKLSLLGPWGMACAAAAAVALPALIFTTLWIRL